MSYDVSVAYSMGSTTPPGNNSQLNQPPVSPSMAGTPTMTPKGRSLHGVASMPSMPSFGSLQSFRSQNDLQSFDNMEFTNLGGDSLYYGFDNFDTTDLDPLSPSFYDLGGPISSQQHPLLTPELSGSVSSGTSLLNPSVSSMSGSNMSLHSTGMHLTQNTQPNSMSIPNQQFPNHYHHHQLLASNVEGLGIAESMQGSIQSPTGSPENPLSRRGKVSGQHRVTKKSSKQTLKQRRSRASLNGETTATPNIVGSPSLVYSPNRPNSAASSLLSVVSIPVSPQKNQPGLPLTSNHLPPSSGSKSTDTPAVPPKDVRASHPGTPLHNPPAPRLRGKAAASPAMRSPIKPGQNQASMYRYQQSISALKPRLPAAAAATALYMPTNRPPEPNRQNAMAAAAAAAAASASSNSAQQLNLAQQHQSSLQNQQTSNPVTPMADKHGSRVSPSTLLVTVKTSAGNVQGSYNGNGSTSVGSPTPAARMSSSSKLVAEASDSSPAKGMWQQKPRRDANVQSTNQSVSRPIVSPRKSASTSNMRKESRRKSPKVIPEMSSSLNQFQVDLKPRTFGNRAPKSAPTQLSKIQTQAHPNRSTLLDLPRDSPGFSNVIPPGQQPMPHYEIPMYDVNQHWSPVIENQLIYHERGMNSVPPIPANSHRSDITRSVVHAQPDNNQPYPSRQSKASPLLVGNTDFKPNSSPKDLQRPMTDNPSQYFTHPVMPVVVSNRPKTAPVNQRTQVVDHKVHPNGEPPQHVWASRPQPVKQQPKRSMMMKQEEPDQKLLRGSKQIPHDQQRAEHLQSTMAPLNIQQEQQQRLEKHQQLFQQQHQQQLMQVHQHHLQQHPPQSYQDQHSNSNFQEQILSGTLPPEAQENTSTHDSSFNNDFISQFINTEWGSEDLDLNAQWDLMDALETPV